MKRPLRAYAKLALAQPQVVGVIAPVLGYGLMCAAAEAVQEYRNQQQPNSLTGNPVNWVNVSQAAKDGFLGGVGAISMMGPALIMGAMRLPTPQLNDDNRLVWAPSGL